MGFSLKKLLGAADKVTEIGARLHLPIVSQIDAAKDALKEVVGKNETHAKKIADIVATLEKVTPEVVSAVETGVATVTGKTPLQSKKFIALLTGIAVLLAGPIAAKLGMDVTLVKEVLTDVATVIGIYLAGQTIHDAMITRNQ